MVKIVDSQLCGWDSDGVRIGSGWVRIGLGWGSDRVRLSSDRVRMGFGWGSDGVRIGSG